MTMLLLVSILKLLAEVALMALAGRTLLGWLAGPGRMNNPFYRVLDMACRPVIGLARVFSPRLVLDRHLPLVATALMLLLWLGALFAKLQVCLAIGMALCR